MRKSNGNASAGNGANAKSQRRLQAWVQWQARAKPPLLYAKQQ